MAASAAAKSWICQMTAGSLASSSASDYGAHAVGGPEAGAEERAERARQLEAEAKRSALQEYIEAGFSPESFVADWPAIGARLAAEKMAERRKRAASPRVYMDGYVAGC